MTAIQKTKKQKKKKKPREKNTVTEQSAQKGVLECYVYTYKFIVS